MARKSKAPKAKKTKSRAVSAKRAAPRDAAKSKGALITHAPNLSDLWAVLMESGTAIQISDMAGNVLYRSDAFRTHIEPALMAQGSASVSAIIHELELTEMPLSQEITVAIHDQRRIFRAHHHLWRDAKGKRAIVSRYEDITAEHSIRQRLILTQSRLDDLTRLTSDWVWETDAELRLQLISPRIMELIGLHPREVLGKPVFALGEIEPSRKGADMDSPAEVARLVPFRDVLFRVQHKDGRWKIFKMSGLPVFADRDGHFMGYRGTAADITEEMEARHLARLSEQRLTHAIESMSEGFCLFDEEGKIVLFNNKFRKFFARTHYMLKSGLDHADFLRQAALAGDIDVGPNPVDEWIKNRMSFWQKTQAAFEVKLSDGRCLLVRDYRMHDGGRVSIASDISDLKQREEALVEAREAAEKANKARGEFFAKMSHELRTPLNAIIGFSDIMGAEKFGGLGAPQYKLYVHDIHESASHLLNVINDILDVSKAEAGKLELIEQNVSLLSAVQSSVRMVIEKAEKNRIEIVSDNVDPNLILRADSKKLKQILINLLSNAVKFTLPDGKIEITTRLDKDGNAVLSVKDSGIGMKEEDIPKALTPFAQIDNSLTRQHDGTGLGLPLCVALAELHGGKLSLESKAGAGTCVQVTFPKSRIVNHNNLRQAQIAPSARP